MQTARMCLLLRVLHPNDRRDRRWGGLAVRPYSCSAKDDHAAFPIHARVVALKPIVSEVDILLSRFMMARSIRLQCPPIVKESSTNSMISLP